MVVEQRNLVLVFLVIEDGPGLAILEGIADQVGTIGDGGVAPVGGCHHDIAATDHAIGGLQRGEDILPVGELRGIDGNRESGSDEAVHRVIAGMHDVGGEAGADLGEGIFLAGENREVRRTAMLVDEGAEVVRRVIAGPFEAGQHLGGGTSAAAAR